VESRGPREGGSAVNGTWAGGAALGADGAGGVGTVGAGADATGSSATGGAGARGTSIRDSLGAGAGRVGESSSRRGGVAFRSGGAGRAAGGVGLGSSMTWTSTGLGIASGSPGRRRSDKKAICDRRVRPSAAGTSHRSRGQGSSRNRIVVSGIEALDGLPGRDREEEVLDARLARLEHRLDHDAARGGAVDRDDHARARGGEAGSKLGRDGVEGDRGAVEE